MNLAMCARAFRSAVRKSSCILLIGLWAVGRPAAETTELSRIEYRVKAGFLYTFAKLTNWPSNSFATADSPIVIGVLGRDPFGAVLDEALRGKAVNGRKIVVQRFKAISEVGRCHVLFVSPSERERLGPIFARAAHHPILTVSDLEQFAREGGMIGLLPPGDGKKFEINLHAAEVAGLRLDSRLLRLAIMVPADERTKEKT